MRSRQEDGCSTRSLGLLIERRKRGCGTRARAQEAGMALGTQAATELMKAGGESSVQKCCLDRVRLGGTGGSVLSSRRQGLQVAGEEGPHPSLTLHFFVG